MSDCGSRLAALSSTHDLKVACAQCCVKEKEITYAVKPIQHQCARSLLLCKVKGGSKWRPVSKRPTFPKPSQYEVCKHFVEDRGCTYHKNRCTFARSKEEAAVWNYVKRYGLDHVLLCNLVAQSERAPDQNNDAEPLDGLLGLLDLRAACDLCITKKKEITYTVQSLSHKCSRNLLFAKGKLSDEWRPVAERPTCGNFGRNVFYQVCDFFVEGKGCERHGQGCTYARSYEEATVWNYIRDNKLDKDGLIRLVAQSEADSITAESAAQSILQQFSGEFVEFCKVCFHERPLRLTTKRWNNTCSADAAHTWDPVLLHHLSENGRKDIYYLLRPLPQNCTFQYCSHVVEGKSCWHEAGRCQAAHSEVEMVVWKAEHSGLLVRPHLLQLSRRKPNEQRQVTMYCRVCLLTLSTPEKFYKHCSSLEHAHLLAQDTTTRWRGRQPPHNRRAEFWLCERPYTCEYGMQCQKAHSEDELQEWVMRAEEEKEIRNNVEAQGLMSYNESLLEEYKSSSNEVHIISEHVDDVSISCDKDLTLECEQIDATLKWNFHIETERELAHVALLKQEPGATFTLDDNSSAPCVYSKGETFLTEDEVYDISVSFKAINPGLYEQWLVLDFDMRPVLLRKLRVRAGQVVLEEDEQQNNLKSGASFQSAERWHRGNRVIIPCVSRKEEQEELLKEYKPPHINFSYKSSYSSKTPLNSENYKERMHHFLYNEERAEDQLVSRLNFIGELHTLNTLNNTHFGMMMDPLIARHGELFCAVSISCQLTPDTPEGLALKRSIQSCLVAPLPSSNQTSPVYEASILRDKSSGNTMYLQLSKQCCSDLQLQNNQSYLMEVQFQLNRHNYCYMHKAVDLLPDMKRVLPDLRKCEVPVNNIRYPNLNSKQQSAIDFITGNPAVKKSVAPLLIYGPFGTGKTFTLATAARELSKKPHNKVLICTYTNSSADLYVRVHFHPFMDEKNAEIRPIRIKANSNVGFRATDEITLKYCLLSECRTKFKQPTKAVLDCHKIVITTTSMARHFQELKLPEGYFTHILIDEASQMLECEALMALGLAGPNTRVVLAGDHMQMGPKLFSVDDHQRSNHTLLNRLFHYYQDQMCDAAQKSRIIFSENYRSTKEIVEFVSTNFYVGKNDVIKATGNIPAPASGHALKFHHIRGECVFDNVSMSWYNKEEVNKVAEEVKEIVERWPSTWGKRDESSICVLSEGNQTAKIRTILLRRGLSKIHVENLANVQGKQFRAIIITAVQTRDSLKNCHLPGLELFNDARVLNTAMTRAQSQVVVVGDAAALCCFGKCSGIWRCYIEHCLINNNTAPQHFTKDFFEKDVIETARFQKLEHVNETDNDAILQELKDEYEQLKTEYSCDKAQLEDFDHQKLRPSTNYSYPDKEISQLCKKQPEIYEHGKFVREWYNRGFVIPFRNPTKRIPIKGRDALGRAFTGDEVILQGAKVLSVTKEDKSARVLTCLLEDEDHSKPRRPENKFVRRILVPFKKSETKVCILVLKDRRNFIPIWEKTYGEWTIKEHKRLNENLKRNNVFVVQVINWRENHYYPLGYVTDIIPVGCSLVQSLKILNEEFKITPITYEPNSFSLQDEDMKHRQDMREVKTFTVDPEGAKDLDDAISVRETGDTYELGVHIADVASFVIRGSKLDEDARHQGATYYGFREKPIHMFPEHLSTGDFSLLPCQDRRVVSLMFKVNKETNEIIEKPRFQLSLIKSDRQLSYKRAEAIISEGYQRRPNFEDIDNCVSVAYCFAKTQRKKRLVDWAYSQPDDRLPGKRKAHLMIEELSVLFNKHASEALVWSGETRYRTPLRCQDSPKPEKVEDFKEKFKEWIPLSFKVRDRVDHDKSLCPTRESFCILTEVWKEIHSAAQKDDIDNLVDLVAADDIHPLLQQVSDQFRRCLNRAYVIRSKSCPEADVGHYSLNVKSYTQATSPIRRYMDIVLQRLLHSFICDRAVQYTREEITWLCNEFENKLKDAKDYEQKAEQISYAVSMKKQSAVKLAFVVCADPDGESFAVSFPFNKNIFAESVSIMYKDLQLDDQPIHDEAQHCMILKWRKRIYAADTMKFHQELNMVQNCSPCIELPLSLWKDTIKAIDKENWDHAKHLIMNADIKYPKEQNVAPQPCEIDKNKKKEVQMIQEHEVEIDLLLKPGDALQVQMTSAMTRGYYVPAVQLVYIRPKFEICVDHVHNSIICFSRFADNPSRTFYNDVDEYKSIWKPLCEMESASTAVDESEGIVIENLVVNFSRSQEQEKTLTGSFFLPEAWMNAWAIECNLSKCLVCIRKRGLKLNSTMENSAAVDPRVFTWVAHGITTKAEDQNVKFNVSHLPMDNIPDCIFEKNTCFTVEIIPKLLPDIRKENAVVEITSACDLVKAIALGKSIPREVQARWNMVRGRLQNGLPNLNKSQREAVDKALNSQFTLIQGPPGTGKTVVGVYIIYRFFELNSENPRIFDNPKDAKKNQVILYCGPSNKSVDVVAEYLLKCGDSPKPLRVYSQQVEMIDYPFPDCMLQFSRRTLRQDRSKPELRSITLHHLMRQDQNPHSEQIRDFDQRINAALKTKSKGLSAEEVKQYKKLLSKARAFELQRHDIILCTCTQSSTPSLTKTVTARQILIDECAMATEPQALIPLVCNKPEKVVLIGDHKQLRPIVRNEHVKKLGMAKSLFERYYTVYGNRAVMLDTQYRMHTDICKFPSEEFYEGKLKTGAEQLSSVLRVDKKTMPIVFGHVKGKTIRLVVKTAKGNENSKANQEERQKVIALAEKLVNVAKIEQQGIVILSPYNAQVSEIRKELKSKNMDEITVTTITKSQGSEWRYVIISTVCSLPSEEIEKDPDRGWLSKNLGFVGDPNQINVGITRAKEGLCIIGDQKLLKRSSCWRNLLEHYRSQSAVTNADNITVQAAL